MTNSLIAEVDQSIEMLEVAIDGPLLREIALAQKLLNDAYDERDAALSRLDDYREAREVLRQLEVL